MGSPRPQGNPFAATSEEEAVQPVGLTAIDLNDDSAPQPLLASTQQRSSDYAAASGSRALPPTKPPAFTSQPVQGVPAPVYGTPAYPGYYGTAAAGGQAYNAPNPYATTSVPPTAAPWTSSYAPADTPLTYSTFETSSQYNYAPSGRLPCGGLGQQWTLFIVGWLIWPLWYVALCLRCYGRRWDPRERAGWLGNVVMSFIFTIVWMALMARYEWPRFYYYSPPPPYGGFPPPYPPAAPAPPGPLT